MSRNAQHTNRLIDATSPYLLQHAHNPVNWHPWDDEALELARREDKPIFLSIGYSACHWCHVMERESFEDEAIAEMLNRHFVSIKVDREERPDIDEIYMSAVQLVTGSGGWPMTVFLTPDLEPFYCGTYFPPHDMPMYGRPGFKRIVQTLADLWHDDREKVLTSARETAAHVRNHAAAQLGARSALDDALLSRAADELRADFDHNCGGFGGAPKFPSPASIALLLRLHLRTGDADLRHMALFTLEQMAQGGIYDHLGGGFHRYAVDAQWLTPHFEKMLYDNAQLAEVFLEAYQLTGDTRFRRTAEETIDYVLRDMTSPEGGFYSSEDADSEGEEGKFYLWRSGEIAELLPEEMARAACAYYNVQPDGNFHSHEPYHHGQNILHVTDTPEQVAKALGFEPEAFDNAVAQARSALLHVRCSRIRPGLDDKALTAWNALMITAVAKAAQVFDSQRYREAAVRAAEFVWERLRVDGRLMRSYRGGQSRQPAFLDDYACLALALLDLYEATFELKWFDRSCELVEGMCAAFWDHEHGGFYYAGNAHGHLIARTKPTYDGAEPSGNTMAATVLLRLAAMTGRSDYQDRALAVLEANAENMRRVPRAFARMLCAVDFALSGALEIVLAGARDAPETAALRNTVFGRFLPNKVAALAVPGADVAAAERMPLLAGKTPANGAVAAYVCRNFACDAPVTSPEALAAALDQPPRSATRVRRQ